MRIVYHHSLLKNHLELLGAWFYTRVETFSGRIQSNVNYSRGNWKEHKELLVIYFKTVVIFVHKHGHRSICGNYFCS